MKAKTQLYRLIKTIPFNGFITFPAPVEVKHNLGFTLSISEIFRPSSGPAQLFAERGIYGVSDITESGCKTLADAIRETQQV